MTEPFGRILAGERDEIARAYEAWDAQPVDYEDTTGKDVYYDPCQ